MQPVRRKQKPAPRKTAALYIALAALAALGLLLWLLLRPAPPAPDGGGPEPVSLTLTDRDETAIVRLTVTPQRSDPYALVRDGETIALENDPDYPLREETVRSLFHYAAHLTADDIAADLSGSKGRSFGDYGLEPGRCRIDAALDNGGEYTIVLGDAVPMEEIRYYARISGDSRVYTVTSDVMDALNVPFYALHPVTRLSIDAGLIDAVRLSGDTVFTAERSDWGWMMTAPVRYPLSGTAMDSLLSSLAGMRFSTWAAEDSGEAREKYGFTLPRLRLQLDFAASTLTVPDEQGETHTYEIPVNSLVILQGGPYSETADYYLYDDGIMTGTILTFHFLRDFSWRDYVAASPFALELNNLSRLTVAREDGHTEYDVRYVERVLPNNAFETDEYGRILYEMRVQRDGRAADAEAFSAYYAGLQALTGQSMLAQPWTPGESDTPFVRMELVSEDGGTAFEIALYPMPDGRDYLAVNGTALMSVPAPWREAFLSLP